MEGSGRARGQMLIVKALFPSDWAALEGRNSSCTRRSTDCGPPGCSL